MSPVMVAALLSFAPLGLAGSVFLQASLWLPAFALVGSVNLAVALSQRPLGALRFPVAVLVALAPSLAPLPEEYAPPAWGILHTLLTTLTIVSAARLPSLDGLFQKSVPTRLELFVWMSLPMARFREREPLRRRTNRARAWGYLGRGLLKRLAWEPLGYLIHLCPGEDVPWPVRSAALMLYFVLNLTAASDLLTGLCLLCGWNVDDLFDAPLRSTSPRDFWSRRWNKFISRFALKHVALPLGRKVSPLVLLLLVFGTSGLFHEYFAWGVSGNSVVFGAMSAFFLVQGFVVWLGTRLPPFPLPGWAKTSLTFVWMMLTAPLFFWPVVPAVLAFGFPVDWLPF